MYCTDTDSFPLNMKKKKKKRQSLIFLKYIQQLNCLVLKQTTLGGFQRKRHILVTYQQAVSPQLSHASLSSHCLLTAQGLHTRRGDGMEEESSSNVSSARQGPNTEMQKQPKNQDKGDKKKSACRMRQSPEGGRLQAHLRMGFSWSSSLRDAGSAQNVNGFPITQLLKQLSIWLLAVSSLPSLI